MAAITTKRGLIMKVLCRNCKKMVDKKKVLEWIGYKANFCPSEYVCFECRKKEDEEDAFFAKHGCYPTSYKALFESGNA